MAAKLKLFKLIVSNFGIHEALTVNFDMGLTVIKGQNGRGKSTLLQAVYFAFGGVSAVDGKAADIPRHGEKNCKVQLFFTLNNVMHAIERTLKDAVVYTLEKQDADGKNELIASGHTAVNSWVEKQLGVPFKLLLMLTYAPQTETAAIMSIGAAELNRMVERVADADFISRVEKKASEFHTQADSGLAVIDTPADVGELRVKLTQAEVLATASGVRLKLCQDAYTTANAAYTASKLALSAAMKNRELYNQLVTKRAMIGTQLTENTTLRDDGLSRLAKLMVTPADVECVARARDEAKRVVDERRQKRQAYMHYTDDVATIENWIKINADKIKLYKELSPQLAEARRYMDSYGAALGVAKVQLSVAKQAMDEAKDALTNSVCKTCNRPIEGADFARAKTKLQEYVTLWSQAEQEYRRIRDEHTNATSRVQALTEKMPSASLVPMEAQYQTKLAGLLANPPPEKVEKEDIQTAECALEDIVREHASLKKDMAAREDLEGVLTKINKKIATLQTTDAEVVAEIEKIGDRDVDAANTVHQQDIEKRAECETALNATQTEHNSAQLSVTAFKHEIDKAETLMHKRAALERRRADFGGLTKYLRENRETFMSQLWSALMADTSQFVANVTEGRITAIQRADDGGFAYTEDDVQRPYARLSGGFKAVAGVGLRLALSELLPAGVSITVLDEPSSELRDDLAANLAGALRATGRQIILVTHRSGEEYASDSVVEL